MPNIQILRFNHFTARKSERYTTPHNGLYIVEEGSLLVHQPDGQEMEWKAGDFALYNSENLLTAESQAGENGFQATALVFDSELLSNLHQLEGAASTASTRLFYPFDSNQYGDIAVAKDLLVSLVSKQKNELAQCHLALALIAMMAEVQPNLLSIINNAGHLSDSQKIIDYIEKNIEKDITLEIVSAELGMSIATLKRRLAADDMSFSHILKVKRINYAATQLRVSQKSITQIAFDSGFKSAAHFSTAFKSVYNMTPKDFRNQITR